MKKSIDFTQIELTYVVPIYLENEKSDVLDDLLSTYSSYSVDVLNKIHFIFVDDGSPVLVEIDTPFLNYSLFRIEHNIPWNQGGARNLGVMQAKSAKIILTDLDHLFPEQIFNLLLKRRTPQQIYQFSRYSSGRKVRPHAGTFFCSKSVYYKSLGFDEEFCGNYGYDDIYFLRLQKKLGTKVKLITKHPIEVREHTRESLESHHTLQRDTHYNFRLLKRKSIHFRSSDPLKGHSRKNVEFTWRLVD